VLTWTTLGSTSFGDRAVRAVELLEDRRGRGVVVLREHACGFLAIRSGSRMVPPRVPRA
jgi:hypothetical protein